MAEVAKKIERTPEHRMRTRVGLTIGRGVWLAGYKIEFPNATADERKAAWKEARKDFKKIGMKALKTLEKNGFEVVEKPEEKPAVAAA
ncbi:hypothetical protein L0664_02950 [Octadecabacter sp. G9-8]|uniref:Uncharacterized protein n=1 Tax=Octadecabacter dasysiphoniae TaxID=2909341 RepID=A0ABS9CUB9_9RHOB|nr:hypothetical protein [Octadecabacter dasysiphoniae]MCF2870015.1 hypothetical protein [Octadecabacter dasysiphoniae]